MTDVAGLTALASAIDGGAIDPAAKAGVLVEALPYIRRFAGKVVVVKYGGNAMAGARRANVDTAGARRANVDTAGAHRANMDTAGALRAGVDAADEGDTPADELALFAEDIVLLHSVGIHVVVVHGGGPQIGDLLSRLGMASTFVDGLRVTDADTLDVVRMVLVGKVNRELVAAVNVHGPLAVGISGEDGHFLHAHARSAELGFVGEVDDVDPTLLQRLLDSQLIPVVATIAMDDEGQAYNVNADAAAGAIAAALGAEKVVYLTDIEGIRRVADDPSTLLSTVSVSELDALIADGSVSGGMIPKVASCMVAVQAGVGHAHVLDGRVPHVLLLEIFTRSGIGTMVTR
jgi:acetylglutamate kinase